MCLCVKQQNKETLFMTLSREKRRFFFTLFVQLPIFYGGFWSYDDDDHPSLPSPPPLNNNNKILSRTNVTVGIV